MIFDSDTGLAQYQSERSFLLSGGTPVIALNTRVATYEEENYSFALIHSNENLRKEAILSHGHVRSSIREWQRNEQAFIHGRLRSFSGCKCLTWKERGRKITWIRRLYVKHIR